MKIRSLVAAASIGFIFLLVHGIKAEAAELKVLSAFGMQSILEDLGPKFERATGHKLAISFATGGGTVKRVQGGDAADVVITLRQGIDTLVKDGKAPAGSVTTLARAGVSWPFARAHPNPMCRRQTP
jgi:molybdate transport system substrate-binding protein